MVSTRYEEVVDEASGPDEFFEDRMQLKSSGKLTKWLTQLFCYFPNLDESYGFT